MTQQLAPPVAEPTSPPAPAFVAPHPGSPAMPRWTTGELIDVPRVGWRDIFAMLGPGVVLSASAIGGGEWLLGPTAEVLGKAGIFYASDWPHWDNEFPENIHHMEHRKDLSDELKRQIFSGTARRLYGL